MSEDQSPERAARREFLERCGKFAIVTPPAMTLLLAASRQTASAAVSGSRQGGIGRRLKKAKSPN